MVSVSVGSRPRPVQRRRIISMSETIANVRRNRLISSGSAVEGEIDQTPRGSPGTFHPPLSSSRDRIEVQQSAIPPIPKGFPPQRNASQPPTSSTTRAPVDYRQQTVDRSTQQLEGSWMINSISFVV